MTTTQKNQQRVRIQELRQQIEAAQDNLRTAKHAGDEAGEMVAYALITDLYTKLDEALMGN